MKKTSCFLLSVFAIYVHSSAQSFRIPKIKNTSFKKDSFNIISFGAKADGITLNTISINNAIDACNKKGGGVVVVPAGNWLTGPLVLKSNVNLHLKRNALLQFTSDFNEYKLIETNWEGYPSARNQSPVSAINASNIAITGYGIIDGNGDAWRMVKKDKLTATQWKTKLASGGFEEKSTWYPSQSSLKGSKTESPGVLLNEKTINDFQEIKDFLRPNLLVLTRCDRILLEGVTFQNSAAWCLHPLMSSNLTIRNISVKNPWYAQNGDGIDVESCSNVLIENSVFDVGDDGICIKSGRDAEGRKRAMPTKDVIIRNCTVYHAHGGFVIGSEMSGGANNISVTNCSFIGTDIGLRFKTTRGRGGVVENIFVDGIAMKDIPGEAILFDMYYAAKDPIPLAGEQRLAPVVEFKPVNETTPQFKNFFIKNVVCTGADKAIFIRGLPEMNIHGINLQDIVISSVNGIEISEAFDVVMNNVKVILTNTSLVADVLNSYNISFNKFSTIANPQTYIRIGGERSKNIKWINSPSITSDEKVVFEFGATQKAFIIQP
ncbi:MAG: glycoside hydrolase family 28 protein [Ferruginibacter sp.]